MRCRGSPEPVARVDDEDDLEDEDDGWARASH
jgi:hypothetical protein